MDTLKFVLITSLLMSSASTGESFKEENISWKNASPETCVCLDDTDFSTATSSIQVISMDEKVASIHAYSDDVAKGKNWNCHFMSGRIVSAVFRHYCVALIPTGGGTFLGERDYDRIEVFHFPKNGLTKMERLLRAELSRIIAIATTRGEGGCGETPLNPMLRERTRNGLEAASICSSD
jgi:hypothetical protein